MLTCQSQCLLYQKILFSLPVNVNMPSVYTQKSLCCHCSNTVSCSVTLEKSLHFSGLSRTCTSEHKYGGYNYAKDYKYSSFAFHLKYLDNTELNEVVFISNSLWERL